NLAGQLFLQKITSGDAGSSYPVGIIAPNDFTAYAVLRMATGQGKVMGADYGLIGFDDDARSCALGLTTVRPPIEAMGEEAGRLLLRALHGEQGGLQVRLRSQVIPRASTDLPNREFPAGNSKVS
ncbi:MAG: substrate-binding domain-containing protein, partial [Fibrella sp.]|nr:substrate-binding domain-containing protein [Armatimonadota bacterium]